MGGPVGHFSGTLRRVDLPSEADHPPARSATDAHAVLRGDGRPGAARHRRGRDRGGRHRRRVAAPVVRPRAARTVGVLDGDGRWRTPRWAPPIATTSPCIPTCAAAGIGTGLARWMRDRPASRGLAVVGMPVPEGSAGDRLLEALGYHVRWNSWVLAAARGRHDRGAAAAGRLRRPRGARPPSTSRSGTVTGGRLPRVVGARAASRSRTGGRGAARRPGFEPWNLQVVADPDGAVVAMACGAAQRGRGAEAYVARLATSEGPSATAGSPRRSSSTRSRSARRTAPSEFELVHRLPHRRAVALREGRHGRHVQLGEPRAGPVTPRAAPESTSPTDSRAGR